MESKIVNKLRLDINRLAAAGTPFLFIIDYSILNPLLFPLDRVPDNIRYATPIATNTDTTAPNGKSIRLLPEPLNYQEYLKAFEGVQKHIKHGNTYLANLTFPTLIGSDHSLDEIFEASRAKYRLLLRDRFVVFSPETFVKIENGVIRTYPMKGTIDASEENALERIMADEKELSEHNTIVDLLRNDLSIFASEVRVTRYRYPDYIRSGNRELIQISSELEGRLPGNWVGMLGDILVSMLPAGSVTGAPKEMTVKILGENEYDPRGYYTGVFGIFDGKSLDSAVMIRFIEQNGDRYVYRSGGGITYLSNPVSEYNELIAKIYVPSG